MRRQSLIALGVAAVLGLLAVFLANTFLNRTAERADRASAGMTKVAVAAVPLDYGAPITPEKVRFVDYPASSVPAGSFSRLPQLVGQGKSRIVIRAMSINEPILASKLSGAGQGASIAALLPDGKRAAAVRINDVSGVGGFVQPNDAVDVLVTREIARGDDSQQITDLLLQNVRVIAIDQDIGADGKPTVAKTATLEVEPIDAQKLALAQQVGALSLVLRKPGEAQNNPMQETVSLSDLRYGLYGGARYNQQANPPRPVVKVLRPVRRPAQPVQQAAREFQAATAEALSSNVEVVRGTVNSSYEVGGYGS